MGLSTDSAVGRQGVQRGVDSLTEEEWRDLLQRFIEGRRATDERFCNVAAMSGSIGVHEKDVRSAREAFESDERLGAELGRLLHAVLQGPEPGPEAQRRYARTFRGLVHVHLSQGSYTLGRSLGGEVSESFAGAEDALVLASSGSEAPVEGDGSASSS